MLEVTFFRDERHRGAGFSARGHVDFDGYGRDVVCAAVSGILQATRLGLAQYANAVARVGQEPGGLELEVRDDKRDSEGVRAILSTAELAIEQIARQYPKHVRLKRVSPQASNNGRDKEF